MQSAMFCVSLYVNVSDLSLHASIRITVSYALHSKFWVHYVTHFPIVGFSHITVTETCRAGIVKCSKDHLLKGKMNVASANVILDLIQRSVCFTVAEIRRTLFAIFAMCSVPTVT